MHKPGNSLLQQTESFAAYQISRLGWRHEYDSILPEGFDAQSLAAQAILISFSNRNLLIVLVLVLLLALSPHARQPGKSCATILATKFEQPWK